MSNVLFTPFSIGSCKIKNRYVMVAMGTGGMVSKENTFNERGVAYYVERAKGGVGLIITGTVYAENEIEKVIPGVMPCPTDNKSNFIMDSAEMCERIHAYGTKIFTQITAGFGRVLKPHLLLKEPVSASETSLYWDPNVKCRALTIQEIKTIIEKTGDTALICKAAGFDGVEIHAVHEGYLLDQFAMKYFNKRTDEYGGDLSGRLKFACDIVKNIKQKCGSDFPVVLRYSLKSYIKGDHQGGLPNEDFVELGRDIDEGIQAAKILTEAGYDALDVDAGTYESWYWAHPPMYFKKGMNIPFGEILKKHVSIPIIIAGRMENPDLAAEAIHDGKADLIGIGRGLLADPFLVNKIREKEFEFVRPCLGCHEGCMNRLVAAKPMCCAVNPTSGREEKYGLNPGSQSKKILVVGAGAAGMEVARVLKLRGHNVEICEKSSQIGGSLLLAGAMPFKEDDIALIKWYEKTLLQLGVPIHLNTEINEDNIEQYKSDTYIIATGSTPKILALAEEGSMILAEDILSKKIAPAQKIAIIGGGLVGSELALSLAGRDIYLLEAQEILSGNLPHMNQMMLRDLLHFNHVNILEKIKIQTIKKGFIKYELGGKVSELFVDQIVCAIGYNSNNKLYTALQNREKDVYILGDAQRVKNIMHAIWDAYELGNNL